MIKSILNKNTTSLIYKQINNISRNYIISTSNRISILNNSSISNSNVSKFLNINNNINDKQIIINIFTKLNNKYYTTSTSSTTSTIEQPIINNTNTDTNDNLNKYNITITDSCVKELQKVQSKLNSNVYLRVMVDMGGCSGYQYIIKVDDKIQEEDVLFIKDGAKIIIDKISLEMMEGSVIDYETSMMRSSFCVASNPNTIKSCGCKISFDLKK